MTGPSNSPSVPLSLPHAVSQALRNQYLSSKKDAVCPPAITTRLLDYLSRRLGVFDLHYKNHPVRINSGWETYIYHFQLQGAEPLPDAFQGPLTLRLFASPQGVPRCRSSSVVQRHLQQQGYPVPAPLFWEDNCEILGGPFLIMEQIVGPTIYQKLLWQPWTVRGVGRHMAELQTALHRLPTDNFPCLSGSMLQRRLDEIHDLVHQYQLDGLIPGLDWLVSHQPALPLRPSILHLDFHPLNLIHRSHRPPIVLDWDEADVGDPHADIATTVLLMLCAPNEGQNLCERIFIGLGRGLLEKFYLDGCRRQMVLDEGKLAYYQALAALRRLARYATWLRVGPRMMGLKPSLVRHLRPDHLNVLCKYFQRLSHIRIGLDGHLGAVPPA